MALWLLSFAGRGDAAVVRAESLTHARLLAALNGLGRPMHFDEGFAIDPELAVQIPPSLIGQPLSGDEAADLLTTLMITSYDGERRFRSLNEKDPPLDAGPVVG